MKKVPKTIFNKEEQVKKQEDINSVIEKEKLNRLIKRPPRVIFKTSGFFPFDFFPDSLIVDEEKVTIINRILILSGEVHSILIKNIKSVVLEMSIIFAALKITEHEIPQNPETIRYLKKKEAIKAKRIIDGIIICKDRGIDLGKIKDTDLLTKIEEIGAAAEERTLL